MIGSIHGSRRLFLSGLLATFSVAPSAVIAGRPLHEADRAFILWLGAVGTYNRQTVDPPEDVEDPYWQAIQASERAFLDMPASPMALAGHELVELSYAAPSDLSLVQCQDRDTSERLRRIECIRSSLSGLIGRVVADFLDNPRRPLGESMLYRMRAKEAVS